MYILDYQIWIWITKSRFGKIEVKSIRFMNRFQKSGSVQLASSLLVSQVWASFIQPEKGDKKLLFLLAWLNLALELTPFQVHWVLLFPIYLLFCMTLTS